MDEQANQSALLAALTTEHFVPQSANSTTYAEASARSTLYVMALSSSLLAIGFATGSAGLLLPFVAVLLPAVFVLGIFIVVRLVETALESSHFINNVVAGVGIALVTRYLIPSAPPWAGAASGLGEALALTWLFYKYQRWRFAEYDVRAR